MFQLILFYSFNVFDKFDVLLVLFQVYYHQQGNGKWCGGKDLASSAAYTGVFCRAILRVWVAGRDPQSDQ